LRCDRRPVGRVRRSRVNFKKESMHISSLKTAGAIAVACAATGSFGQSLPPDDIYPAGSECAFNLRVQYLEPDTRKFQEKRNGTLLLTGAFGSLKFINDDTGESITLPSKGAVLRAVPNDANTPPLSYTYYLTGHWVLIAFATDKPAGIGPSVIEYTGRLVLLQEGKNYLNSTLISQQGRQVTDICAALTPP